MALKEPMVKIDFRIPLRYKENLEKISKEKNLPMGLLIREALKRTWHLDKKIDEKLLKIEF